MLLLYFFYAYLMIIIGFGLVITYLNLTVYQEHWKRGNYRPKVLVIVPCRGMDYKLEENLTAFKKQKYDNYKLVAVIDDKKDKALPVIKKLNIGYLVCGRPKSGSGKVNAIAVAIEKLGKGFDVFAIGDADILTKDNWLADLITPLKNQNIGIATAYPYFKAENGFWSKVKMIWSLVGDGMMETKLLRFGWGGSLAFRRDLMNRADLEKFKGAIADDVALTKLAKSKELGLAYVSSAKPIMRATDNFPEFVEWSNRQTALSMMSNMEVFYIGFPYYLLNFLLFISAVLLTIFYSYIFILLFIPVILGLIKTGRRLQESYPDFVIISLIMPLVFMTNLLISYHITSIIWRGRRYKIK